MSRTLVTVGVDIGQLHDPTTISVVRFRGGMAEVPFLERLPLRTKYPDVARRVANLLHNLQNQLYAEGISAEVVVLVDVTGIGRATFDMVQEVLPKSIRAVAVTLLGGQGVPPMETEWRVPKQELVDNLRRFMEQDRLHVAVTSNELRTLQSELRTFLGTKTGADSISTEARSGAHDDLVIAVGLALLPGARKRQASRNSRSQFVADGTLVRRRQPRALSTRQQQIQAELEAQTVEDRITDQLQGVQRIRVHDHDPAQWR